MPGVVISSACLPILLPDIAGRMLRACAEHEERSRGSIPSGDRQEAWSVDRSLGCRSLTRLPRSLSTAGLAVVPAATPEVAYLEPVVAQNQPYLTAQGHGLRHVREEASKTVHTRRPGTRRREQWTPTSRYGSSRRRQRQGSPRLGTCRYYSLRGALGGTRTHGLSLRRAALYPAELRAREDKKQATGNKAYPYPLLRVPCCILPSLVPKGGFEPPRPYGHYALNVARLPFRHFGIAWRRRPGPGTPHP